MVHLPCLTLLRWGACTSRYYERKMQCYDWQDSLCRRKRPSHGLDFSFLVIRVHFFFTNQSCWDWVSGVDRFLPSTRPLCYYLIVAIAANLHHKQTSFIEFMGGWVKSMFSIFPESWDLWNHLSVCYLFLKSEKHDRMFYAKGRLWRFFVMKIYNNVFKLCVKQVWNEHDKYWLSQGFCLPNMLFVICCTYLHLLYIYLIIQQDFLRYNYM